MPRVDDKLALFKRFALSTLPSFQHHLNFPNRFMDSAIYVWIEVDGVPARMLDKAFEGSNFASSFVEAKESQTFKVVFADRRTAGPKQSYALEILFDGIRVGSNVIENHNPFFHSPQDSNDRVFSFDSNQETKNSLACASCDESFGRVSIKYHRVNVIEEGGSKSRGRNASRTSRSEYVDRVDEPYLSFEFRYASQAHLAQISATPRSTVGGNTAALARNSSSRSSSSSSRRRIARPRSCQSSQQVTEASSSSRKPTSASSRQSSTQPVSTPISRQTPIREDGKPSIAQLDLALDTATSPPATAHSSSSFPAPRIASNSDEIDSDDECEILKRKIASLKRQEEIASLEDEVREKEKKRKLKLRKEAEEKSRKKIKLESDGEGNSEKGVIVLND